MVVSAPFEDVLEVSEYFDGPRNGVALYLGRPHKFRSLWFDVYGADDTANFFELTPLDPESPAPVRMRGIFEVAPDAPVVAAGQLRKLVVRWIPDACASV
jgi:hypothetical protein